MIYSRLRLRRLLARLICLGLLLAAGRISGRISGRITAQEARLSQTGPWLVYPAEDGLIAANPDGSGRTRLIPATPETEFLIAPAPTGDRFLLVTLASGASGIPHTALRLIQLPGGGGRALRPTLLPDGPVTRLLAPLLLDALRSGSGLVWSPGGERAAFASAHSGQPALVLFNANSGTSTALDTGGAIAENIQWAAHGRHLLWEARGLDGRRTVMTASFASASGRIAERPAAALALPESPAEGWRFLGWQTPDQALFSARQGNALRGLVAYDFITGESAVLLPSDLSLTAAGVLDETVLFGLGASGSLPAGLYRLETGGTWTLLQPGPVTAIRADAAREAFWVTRPDGNLLLPAAGGAAQALPTGTPYPADAGPAVAILRTGAQAWSSLWLAPQAAVEPALIWPGQSAVPAWSADGRTLYAVLRPTPGEAAGLSATGLAAIPIASGQPSFLDARALPGPLAVLTPRALTRLADRDVPLRDLPGPGGTVQATLAGDESIARLQGRNRLGDWVAVELTDGRSGWLPRAALTTTEDTAALTILR